MRVSVTKCAKFHQGLLTKKQLCQTNQAPQSTSKKNSRSGLQLLESMLGEKDIPKAYKQVFIYANTVQTLPSLFTPISQALKKVKLARKTSSIIQIKVILRHDTHLKKTKKFKNSGLCFLNTNKCQGMYNTGQGKITKTDSEE